jgi:hypothetical protein
MLMEHPYKNLAILNYSKFLGVRDNPLDPEDTFRLCMKKINSSIFILRKICKRHKPAYSHLL